MPTTFTHRIVTLTICLAAAAAAACTSTGPTDTGNAASDPLASHSGPRVPVCHLIGKRGAIVEVPQSALALHLAHGDYVTSLFVSHQSSQPADNWYFHRISDALASARAGRVARGELHDAACRITITVSGEAYRGTATGDASGEIEHFPLVVDVPDISLRGALVMGLDRFGRATGDGRGGEETTLVPVEPLPVLNGVSIPIIMVNAHPDGSAGDGLSVQGFVFQSGHDPAVDAGGQGILAVRATGLSISGNRFEAGFTESLDLRGGRGEVVRNHLGGGAGTCDICLAGPGVYSARGNRLLAGGIPGIVVFPQVNLPLPDGVEPVVIGTSAEVWADIGNNEVRDHLRIPVGVGIRVGVVGIGVPNVHGVAHAVIHNNLLVNNRFGIILEAGFPLAGTARLGDMDVTLAWNDIQQSCQAKLYVSLARHTTGLGLNGNAYLMNSTYRLRLWGSPAWADAWYANPADFGNTLTVNGATIDNGSRQFYDAVGCPGLQN